MTSSRAVLAAAAALLALAGCSSGPEPAEAPTGTLERNCEDGQLSAKSALISTVATDVSLPSGCDFLSVTVPDGTAAAAAKGLCDTAAADVYTYGIGRIVVATESGTELAVGNPSTPCRTGG